MAEQRLFDGKKHSDLTEGDFLYMDDGTGKFPIVTAQDVADAIPNLNRPGLSKSYAEIKRLLIARAKDKGAAFVAQLPKAWAVEKAAAEMTMPAEPPDAPDDADDGAAPKFDPATVDYTPGTGTTVYGEDVCANCLYFQKHLTDSACALVNGIISPAGSCDLFTGKPVAIASDPGNDPMPMMETEEALPPILRETYMAAFGGKYPDVPFAPGVDAAQLVQGDPEPFFVTLPIAEVGRVSENGLHYDDELVNSLAEQINRDRPTGIRGHIKDDERQTAYPSPEIYWVGAKRIGAKLYAKGYIPPGGTGSAREEYRIHKATRAKIATSIYGKPLSRTALPEGYKVRLQLEHVDLAPYQRAALKLGGDFEVTHEFTEEKGKEMDANELRTSILGLTPEALAEMLDTPAQEKLLAALAAKSQKKVVAAELATVDSAALAELQSNAATQATTIQELTTKLTVHATALAEYQRKDFGRELDGGIAALTDWQVKTADGQAKLAALRSMLRSQVVAEFAGAMDVAQIPVKAAAVLEAQKLIVEAVRDALAGPAAFVAGTDRDASPQLKLATREESDLARAELGI